MLIRTKLSSKVIILENRLNKLAIDWVIKKMNKLFNDDLAKINTLGKAKFSCINTIEYLKKLLSRYK